MSPDPRLSGSSGHSVGCSHAGTDRRITDCQDPLDTVLAVVMMRLTGGSQTVRILWTQCWLCSHDGADRRITDCQDPLDTVLTVVMMRLTGGSQTVGILWTQCWLCSHDETDRRIPDCIIIMGIKRVNYG